jgi:DNA-binding beta-propeller fold protein YncE
MLRGIVRLTTALVSATSALLLLLAPGLAAAGDTVADAALGQPDLVSSTCNNGGISASTLCFPSDVAMDPATGRIFVADVGNARVLGFPNTRRFVSGEAADVLFGQPDFTTSNRIRGCLDEITADSLCDPSGVAVDRTGHVYVADTINNRVLQFTPPFSNGQVADLVLGQPDFTTRGGPTGGFCQIGGSPIGDVPAPHAANLCQPHGLAFDPAGRLYVADFGYNRVLRYSAPFHSGQAADLVLGQPDFTTRGFCQRGPTSRDLCQPWNVASDPKGGLFVADGGLASHVLRFSNPVTNYQGGDLVLGQPECAQPDGPGVVVPISARGLCTPHGVLVDGTGNVYVSDYDNSRVLRFGPPPLSSGQAAELVLGQPDFTTGRCNVIGDNAGDRGLTTASSLCFPQGLTLDFRGDVFIADSSNNRVLRYDQPSNGTQPPTGTRSLALP